MANLLAKRLSDRYGTDMVRAYTFASPNTCISVKGARYGTIFNFVRDEDFFTRIPLSGWGYTKYGRTISLSDCGDIATRYRILTGEDYIGFSSDEAAQQFLCTAMRLAPNVHAYYERTYPVGGHEIALCDYMLTAAQILSDETDENTGELMVDAMVSEFAGLSDFLTRRRGCRRVSLSRAGDSAMQRRGYPQPSGLYGGAGRVFQMTSTAAVLTQQLAVLADAGDRDRAFPTDGSVLVQDTAFRARQRIFGQQTVALLGLIQRVSHPGALGSVEPQKQRIDRRKPTAIDRVLKLDPIAAAGLFGAHGDDQQTALLAGERLDQIAFVAVVDPAFLTDAVHQARQPATGTLAVGGVVEIKAVTPHIVVHQGDQYHPL